jgi:hypothetical protein
MWSEWFPPRLARPVNRALILREIFLSKTCGLGTGRVSVVESALSAR